MYSIRSDRPLGADALALLQAVDHVLKTLELLYFIVGAMARDILLTHVFGLDTRLATRDLDIGVAVRDWSEFELVAAKLSEDANFVQDPKMVHRLRKDNYPLDIIPYDGVETPEHTIAWPPDREVVMNVAGFQDAFEAAVVVQVEAGLDIRVVSLPGLAVLKFLAWSDRGTVDSRDARDLATLLRSYVDAGNNDRLYEAEFDAMEAVDFNLELAGARLLGRDARLVASEDVRAQVLDLLRDSIRRTRLATDMTTVWSNLEDVTSVVEKFLEQFQEGLQGH